MRFRRLMVLSVALGSLGCATAYQPNSYTGGFKETKPGDRLWQVRFNANAYTTQDRVSVFLMRRCAELTLEQGYRYFALADSKNESTVGSAGFFGVVSFPSGEALLRILESKDEVPIAIDAVTVISSTHAESGGRLSERAAAQIRAFTGDKSPTGSLLRGTVLYGHDGNVYGTVLETYADGIVLVEREGGTRARIEEALALRYANQKRR